MEYIELSKAQVAVYQESKLGQQVCGDAYVIEETESYLFLGIADGLGSGVEARKAADRAVSCFRQSHHLPTHLIIQECNKALTSTRGAVAGIMKIDYQHSCIAFAGIGNIQCYFYTPSMKLYRAISKPGFLNGRPIQAQGQTVPYAKETTFAIFSDGLEMNRGFFDQRIHQNPVSFVKDLFLNEKDAKDDLTIIAGRACLDLTQT